MIRRAPLQHEAWFGATIAGKQDLLSPGAGLFVSAEDLQAFTGLKQPSAQARFLAKHGIKFMRRLNGTIALRQEELDSHTLSRPAENPQREWEPNYEALAAAAPKRCKAKVEEKHPNATGAKTRRRPCKLYARDGSDYCWTHGRWRARRA